MKQKERKVLERIAAVSLLRDTLPNYYALTEEDKRLVWKVGLTQIDTMGEEYQWTNLSVLTIEEMYELYEICSKSWKKNKNT